jgi:hypothetical protein
VDLGYTRDDATGLSAIAIEGYCVLVDDGER